MKFILQYPEVTGLDADMLDCGDVGEIAAHAEAAGFATGRDAGRHRDAFAGYEEAGTTWLVVGATSPTPDRHRAFIETFGETYLAGTSLSGGA